MRAINEEIEALKGLDEHQSIKLAGEMRVPISLLQETRELGRLSVVNFAAGGVATPADAALMMALGLRWGSLSVPVSSSPENPSQMAPCHRTGRHPLSGPGQTG